jgi:AcrR family transcriptional regulator
MERREYSLRYIIRVSTGTAQRRRYSPRLPRAERSEQILDASLRLIAHEGFTALTMDRVAAEAGIAKSVIYAIFGSQSGLQYALLKREQERANALSAEALGELTSAADPIAGCTLALMRYLDGVAAHPDTWRLVLLPVNGTPPAVRQAILDGRERWRREIEPVATRLLARAGLKGLDAELAAHLVRGNAEYLARLILEEPERYTHDRILGFAAQIAHALAAANEKEQP